MDATRLEPPHSPRKNGIPLPQVEPQAISKVKDLPSLTSLRAVAATMVFAFHAQLLHIGSAGVAFFFVLSGFVLTWGYQPSRSTRQFYLRRFARIYPLHALVWLVLVLSPWLSAKPNNDWLNNFANLFLLQAWALDGRHQLTVALVTWSLSCEVFFYAVFPFAVRFLLKLSLPKLWLLVGLSFMAVEVLVVITTFSPLKWVTQVFYANPLIRLPEFLVGIAIGLSIKAGARLRWYWAVLPFGISIVGFITLPANPALNVWGALASAVLVAAFAQWDIAGKSRITTNRAFIYAGKISFAFYLVHLVILGRANHSLVGLPIPHLHMVAQVVAFLASVAVAVALHHLVEQPVHNWILRKRPGKVPSPVEAA
jgi:peptidoglycan/LPS O-acetylase OafA/YrhL